MTEEQYRSLCAEAYHRAASIAEGHITKTTEIISCDGAEYKVRILTPCKNKRILGFHVRSLTEKLLFVASTYREQFGVTPKSIKPDFFCPYCGGDDFIESVRAENFVRFHYVNGELSESDDFGGSWENIERLAFNCENCSKPVEIPAFMS